jgi:hypothetical protein
MFGRSRPVVFDPYRGRRRSRVPRWLWLLLAGVVAGAAGVIGVQERLLPPRLSAAETTRLRTALDQAVAERDRLRAELTDTASALDASRAALTALQASSASMTERTQAFDEDLAFVVDALPPDPRGGSVAVRAARFSVRQGSLDFAVALSHEGRPMDAVLELSVSGSTAGGGERRAGLQPVALRLAPRHVARGRVPLPAGFEPELVTVSVLDKAGGRRLGMRIVRVN